MSEIVSCRDAVFAQPITCFLLSGKALQPQPYSNSEHICRNANNRIHIEKRNERIIPVLAKKLSPNGPILGIHGAQLAPIPKQAKRLALRSNPDSQRRNKGFSIGPGCARFFFERQKG